MGIPCVFITFFGKPNWGIIFGNVLASLLYGAAMIAIGLFISSLTISQIIAAIGTFAVAIFLMIIDTLSSAVNSVLVTKIVAWISFNSRYASFTQGLLSFSNLVFFLSVAAVFIFLTARRLESRRWS
jgi:ABC-2 type transport system permease protein